MPGRIVCSMIYRDTLIVADETNRLWQWKREASGKFAWFMIAFLENDQMPGTPFLWMMGGLSAIFMAPLEYVWIILLVQTSSATIATAIQFKDINNAKRN